MAGDLMLPQLRASGIGWYTTTVGLAGLIASIIAGQFSWEMGKDGDNNVYLIVPSKDNILSGEYIIFF